MTGLTGGDMLVLLTVFVFQLLSTEEGEVAREVLEDRLVGGAYVIKNQ